MQFLRYYFHSSYLNHLVASLSLYVYLHEEAFKAVHLHTCTPSPTLHILFNILLLATNVFILSWKWVYQIIVTWYGYILHMSPSQGVWRARKSHVESSALKQRRWQSWRTHPSPSLLAGIPKAHNSTQRETSAKPWKQPPGKRRSWGQPTALRFSFKDIYGVLAFFLFQLKW